MSLTTEQRNVFGLALEILECNGSKAMDHTAHANVHNSCRPGQRQAVEWAVDYLAQLSEIKHAHLVARAHVGSGEWTQWEIRACGIACRWFYRRLHQRRLYTRGVRYLHLFGG